MRRGFVIASSLFVAISVALFLTVFANCRERFREPIHHTKVSLRHSLVSLARNGPWLLSVTAASLLLMRLGALIAITIYFAIHVLHNPWMISALLPLISVGHALAAVAAPAYFKRFGVRVGSIAALTLGAALFALLPMLEGRTWVFLVVYGNTSLAVGLCPTSLFAMFADSVDYQQWRFGTRDDGLIFSSMSLCTKVGMAAGGALIAYALALTHFDPKAVTLSMQGTIRSLYYWVPPALMLIQTVPMFFYTLDTLHTQIVRELANRSGMQLDSVALAREADGI
jgi:GPH family glycoside/pentoside/hexuronide:cation symporter